MSGNAARRRAGTRFLHRVYRTPTPIRAPLLSQAEMVRRIELARLEAAPAGCPTCGSTTTELLEQRRCRSCGRWRAGAAFWGASCSA